MSKAVTIIGSGISGLTTAIVLLEAGFQVEIITEKLPEHTTSAVAGAIWFPYEINPKEKANEWSLASYLKFKELAENPLSGVNMEPFSVLVANEADAWWLNAMPQNAAKKRDTKEAVCYDAIVPVTETPVYMKFLWDWFIQLGGSYSLQKISNIYELAATKNAVINCTGLGARELLNDREMFPVFGQVVKIDPLPVNSITSDIVEVNPEEVAYIIKRKDCLVLGGTVIKGRENELPDATLTKGIIERCQNLAPELKDIKIQSVTAGLRPGRTSVRLERENNIIHNYGHGGGGYTVSWGCAYEVRKLMS